MPPEVFSTPPLVEDERRAVSLIDALREQLRHQTAQPRRWMGFLRRQSFARAVRASNSIEGINASLDDVVAVMDGDQPAHSDERTARELAGYRDAMTYVIQMAADDEARLDAGILRSLHFMILGHDLDKLPGRWRRGPVFIHRDGTGEQVYEGPPSDEVPGLIDSMLEHIRADDSPSYVRAAMAHLNLVMIHPFKDGNGRMARCLQTAVLGQERVLEPVFSSIEEHLGRNTPAYHEVLERVGMGAWNPGRDARPWIRFCLTAHYHQAWTYLRRVRSTEALWSFCSEQAERHDLPERSIAALMDAAQGRRLRNSSYRAAAAASSDEGIDLTTATRDLRRLVEVGLLLAHGENRGRSYLGGPALLAAWQVIRREVRPPRSTVDPFDERAHDALQMQLDLS